ncbi:TIGR03086 family metal-binding protein [Streptomyces sp. NPDC004111]|uniref:TIGR03086 family metal-binding protein n=1 Tax=Streptomyces sp. NPDC004111 TaxID=3364690 RepID=UPI0036B9AE43
MLDLKPACQGMTEVLAGVRDQQMSDPTPCEKYDVTDLVGHIVMLSRAFTATARKEAQDDAPAAGPEVVRLPENWRADLAGSLRELGEAWDDPAAWEGVGGAGVGFELPNELWGRIALTEVVVHGWDLARATGQPFELPEQTLRDCYAHVSGFVVEAGSPELWGPPVEVAPDAPLLHRVLGVTGRRP